MVTSLAPCRSRIPAALGSLSSTGWEGDVARQILADIAASVSKIVVAEGDTVSAHDTVVILESMKMEIPIEAGADGTIASIHVDEGSVVQEGDVIAVID